MAALLVTRAHLLDVVGLLEVAFDLPKVVDVGRVASVVDLLCPYLNLALAVADCVAVDVVLNNPFS